jgi:hypothetical protein
LDCDYIGFKRKDGVGSGDAWEGSVLIGTHQGEGGGKFIKAVSNEFLEYFGDGL